MSWLNHLFVWQRSCFKLGPLVSCASPREQRSLTAIQQYKHDFMLSSKCRHREHSEQQQGHIHHATLQLHPQFQPWTPGSPSDQTISILLWSCLLLQHNYLALHIARCRQVYLWALHTFSCSPYLLSSLSWQEPLLITTNNYSIVTVCTLYNQFIIDLCLCYYGN